MDANERFLTLFLKAQPDLKAFVASLVRDRGAVEDLVQEVSLALWQSFASYDPGRPFGAWARGVAAKKILQAWEKARRLPRAFSPEAVQAVLDAYERSESSAAGELEGLKACMAQLPERSRHLLSLRYQKALRLGEIARQVNSTLDAVHKLLSRIRSSLQVCVKRRLAAGQEGS